MNKEISKQPKSSLTLNSQNWLQKNQQNLVRGTSGTQEKQTERLTGPQRQVPLPRFRSRPKQPLRALGLTSQGITQRV